MLEQGAAAAGHLPPPVPPLSGHVNNVTPSPPFQRQHRYHAEMVASKVPPLAKFRSDVKNLEGWILQMDDYFTLTQTRNKQQLLAYVGLCIESEGLELWKANWHRYTT